MALFSYEGPARDLVARLKYRPHHQALRWLGEGLAAAVADYVESEAVPAVGLVTWAPTTARHRRSRGFDQAELLARAVGRGLRVPVACTLQRRGSQVQTGRRASERRAGGPEMELSAGAGPKLRRARGAAHLSVLVVDDIVTTGATLRAARWALSDLGFPVLVGALARTPAPGRANPRPVLPADLTGRAH